MGFRGEGTKLTLYEYSERLGYEVEVLPPLTYRGEIVSSSRIRHALAAGDLETVRALLGRRYAVRGRVIRGRRTRTPVGLPHCERGRGRDDASPLPASTLLTSVTTVECSRRRLA
ncbi:MAG: hypothetical protein KatS3mg115_2641 [Candidatus Poribacteria bacterium]|nr:MAG: hypothetical protein KatS3mg115_2641 [Candidatus Poribacteria bacterium]